ncbi:methylglyoxal synthase [Thalassorhabdus alkalitolerans]|uniref:Methylglyoxal synthase n=1 Tax=Thalassorhabdus alkalitolerans TaxID=2282697 RepID=A0ABW0YR48_9BACI|nr:methylglyoxal synthase [Thalassobacillus sp. C254]
MNIALIAHDQKKQDMVTFTIEAKEILKDHKLYATGTTGKRITEAANLDVTRFLSGPLGGDQQIGSLVASNDIDLVIFFRDPLMAQPHEPDISALLRLCDVHNVPAATNPVSARVMIKALHEGLIPSRQDIAGGAE